ncbi:MAG: phosphate acyltransferase PlsX [Clostridium sp.]
MKVVIDGMGGDNAPQSIVEGAVQAQREYGVEIVITGPLEIIQKELDKYDYDRSKISILHASEVISTEEEPTKAIRRKKDSSINRALELVKNGEADAIVSAGSTGALLTGATLMIGRIKGVLRPALAPIMPGKNGDFMLIDCGANVDCKPKNLEQFALMGKAYFETVMKVSNPTIGLINIGTEEEKGNALTKEVHKILKESPINFVGNVEPRDIPLGDVNVLVCDGFVGNTVLKTIEGVAGNIFSVLKEEIYSSFKTKIGGVLLKSVFAKFKKDYDYKEYGGAGFLGVKSICIKAHGSSDAKALKNAIRQAKVFHDNKIIEIISSYIEEDVKLQDEKIKE